jgi:hypothetical protein
MMVMFTSMLLAGMGCANMSLTAIDITPSSDTQILNRIGEKAQFTAIGTYTGGKHLPRTEDLTQQVTWASSDTSVATVDAGGAVTAVGSGTALITASTKGGLGVVQGTSNVKVTLAQRTLVSLAIIPSDQKLVWVGETAQFLAIGTYSSGSPLTQDLTNQVNWRSSDVHVARIDSSGLATGGGNGDPNAPTTISAVAMAADGSVITATATVESQALGGPIPLPTMAVYKVGTGSGTVTGTFVDAITGVTSPVVINCGSGGSCSASAAPGSQFTLLEQAADGSTFDGWSGDCKVVFDPAGPQCVIVMNNNTTVGAIFDKKTP